MRKIREVLRLKFELDLSERQISKSTQVSRSAIGECLRRFVTSGIVNQRAVFASKQRALLPTVLMPSLIKCGFCNFSTVLIF